MDPSGSFGADQASGQSSEAKDSIGMKADYYNGAANGEIGVFKDIGRHLDRLLTPNRNTVLHIYLTSLKVSGSNDSKPEESKSPTTFVKEILGICPSLLWLANVKGETPLHIAARYGHAAVVEVLIEHARIPQQDLESGLNKTVKEMLETTNNEKDTALHEAIRNNHLAVVKRLIEEGPDFSYSQNKAGETLLYIAVERNYEDVALHILDKCKSPAHEGPLGRTTLHAAVIRCAGYFIETGMINKILQKIAKEEQSDFIKQVDEQGWTPLHCAAYFNCSNTIDMLLEVDRSIAYMKDAKGMTALHIAAHKGHVHIMKELLKYCPDCCEIVDQRGWNALHFIVNSSSNYWAEIGIEYILEKPLFNNLFNEKDDDGNTPLHHHSKSLHYIEYVMGHDRVDKMAFNKQNLSAYDIALTSEELSKKKFMQINIRASEYSIPPEFRRPLEDILPERKDYECWKAEREARKAEWKARKDRFVSIMEKASNSHLVVDTLIATVAFTAGITMPGGFIGQEGLHSGSPVLMRNTAFKVFIITNTIAMVQSCSAAFIHLFMPLLFDEKNVGEFSFLLASLAFCLSISAMGAMALAFVMGTYAVLMLSLGLAIANSVIGLLFFIPVFFVCIGCLDYLLEILKEGSIWILDKLGDFKYFLDNALDDILDCCTNCFSRGDILYLSSPV